MSPRLGGQIIVIAGVNGAGKSSLAGNRLRSRGLPYWDPDERTRRLLEADPALTLEEANAAAWHSGKELLEGASGGDRNLLFRSSGCRALGDAWVERGESALLRVPSAVVPEEENVLLNPRHRDAARFRVTSTRPFSFDARLGR